jgi:anti-sigma regulatory factor (Ser/Thr protein kinase)
MFVTCLYAVLELDSGKLVYANAGHNPPYCYGSQRTEELRARGMPLGLMPVMKYEELETVLAAGERLLLYSDGITEAHNQGREMFGFDRIKALVDVSPLENPTQLAQGGEDSQFIRILLDELSAFTGAGWEQEDDVTVVILNRQPHPQAVVDSAARQDPAPEINTTSVNPISAEIHTGREVRMDSHGESALTKSNPGPDTHLAHFQVQSQPGNERQAMRQVVEAVESLGLDLRTLERLKTAVAEATMNAMEHGNQFQADLLVDIDVRTSGERLSVTIRDYGGSQPIPDAGKPDLDAKLAGEQSPRGWGLFLIEKMVDEMNVSSDESRHTVELVIYIQRAQS